MRIILSIFITFFLVSPLYAAIIFQDDFDNESRANCSGGQGLSCLNYDFDNWNSVNNQNTTGTVDLVQSGTYSTTGSGFYVDLDGSTNDSGRFQTEQVFSFLSGVTYRLSFDLSGDQRGDGTNYTRSIVTTIDGAGGQPPYINELIAMSSNDVWTNYSYTFAGQDINGRIVFRSDIRSNFNDNIGLLLDNVVLETVEVTEPGSIALIFLGLIGLGMSRRKLAIA
jgi:hypothetical protein